MAHRKNCHLIAEGAGGFMDCSNASLGKNAAASLSTWLLLSCSADIPIGTNLVCWDPDTQDRHCLAAIYLFAESKAGFSRRLKESFYCSHKDLLQELLEALGVALWVHRRYAVAIVKDGFVTVLYPFAHIVFLHMTTQPMDLSTASVAFTSQ